MKVLKVERGRQRVRERGKGRVGETVYFWQTGEIDSVQIYCHSSRGRRRNLIRLIAHSIYKYVSTISLLRPSDVHWPFCRALPSFSNRGNRRRRVANWFTFHNDHIHVIHIFKLCLYWNYIETFTSSEVNRFIDWYRFIHWLILLLIVFTNLFFNIAS